MLYRCSQADNLGTAAHVRRESLTMLLCLVPQAHRMTAAKKRLELLQLAAGVHALKSAFNGRFASLRSLKLSIIDEVNKLYARLREVNSQLGIHGAWPHRP